MNKRENYPVKSYKDLLIWQNAIDIADAVYDLCAQFPADEKFGLTSQFKRASLSIGLNIAEGYGRKSQASMLAFFRIAMGSLYETETCLHFAERRQFVNNDEQVLKLKGMIDSETRMILGFIQAIRKSTPLTTSNNAA